jgi:hypothetical protein
MLNQKEKSKIVSSLSKIDVQILEIESLLFNKLEEFPDDLTQSIDNIKSATILIGIKLNEFPINQQSI